jgi:hypothetical protein
MPCHLILLDMIILIILGEGQNNNLILVYWRANSTARGLITEWPRVTEANTKQYTTQGNS